MKNILVAGAGKGIGFSVAKKLSANNNVLAISRTSNPDLAHENIISFLADFTNEASLENIPLPDTLHGLVFCPGSIHLKPFTRLTTKDFLADFEQNVTGAVRIIQKCIPHLKRSGNASVVLYSTVAVKVGMPFHSSVAASKGAIEGLVRSLAAEYASNNIRFNAIAPSLVDTSLSSSLINTAEKKEAAGKRHPLQRIGNADEIAALTAFLLSDNASWMTGQVIGIDGGMGNLK